MCLGCTYRGTCPFFVLTLQRAASPFDMVSCDSDIAPMQLDVPLEYTTAVRPLFLPNSPVSSSSLCIASGWKITEEGRSSDFCMLLVVIGIYTSISILFLCPDLT